MRVLNAVLVAGALSLVAASSAQAADAAHGATVFKQCAICHKAAKDAPNGIGPNLFGVVGRKAGTVAGFSYSPALKASNIKWTEDTLKQWLSGPAKMVPGNKMPFAGMAAKPDDMADVIEYMETLK